MQAVSLGTLLQKEVINIHHHKASIKHKPVRIVRVVRKTTVIPRQAKYMLIEQYKARVACKANQGRWRDLVLLINMHASGARAQEICDLTIKEEMLPQA